MISPQSTELLNFDTISMQYWVTHDLFSTTSQTIATSFGQLIIKKDFCRKQEKPIETQENENFSRKSTLICSAFQP